MATGLAVREEEEVGGGGDVERARRRRVSRSTHTLRPSPPAMAARSAGPSTFGYRTVHVRPASTRATVLDPANHRMESLLEPWREAEAQAVGRVDESVRPCVCLCVCLCVCQRECMLRGCVQLVGR